MLTGDDATLETAADAMTKISIPGLWDADDEERDDAQPARQEREEPQDDEIDEQDEVEASDDDTDETDDGEEGSEKSDSAEFIEVPDPNGGEPTKIAVAEAVEAYKNWTALGGNVAAVVQRAEERVYEAARERVTAYNTALQQGITTMQSWITALPTPQMPSIELKNPRSPHYDPDAYDIAKYHYDQAVGLLQRAHGQVQQMQQEKAQNEALLQEQLSEREWKKLVQADPEWGRDPEGKRNALLKGLQEHYGLSEAELEDIYNHQLYLVAQDALAFRAMKKAAPTLKRQVQEKAAKVTGTRKMPQSVIDQKRQSGVRQQLKKTGSVDAAAGALLARLDKFL